MVYLFLFQEKNGWKSPLELTMVKKIAEKHGKSQNR